RALGQALGGGVLLGAANGLLVLALAGGQLAIVAVLVGLYPAVTVLLATLLGRERMASAQLAGVLLALAASLALALV
ncbi:MAG: hypothetical protein QM635_09650, partial [Microbacteriaceae bacterium]